jgi:ribosomal protein S18 acetylase RimI-like enzyme
VTDQWLSPIRLKLPPEQFRLLPRNPAYKYELIQGETLISPRPRYFHAMLDLESAELPYPAEVPIRPLRPDDWPELPALFMRAFTHQLPFSAVSAERQAETAQTAIEWTRTGGDGPIIESACFVALSGHQTIGAILVTLLPLGDPEEFDTYACGGEVAPDAIDRCDGWPHLTWILVDPWEAGRGVGTALLAAAAEALRQRGFNDLLSTFLLGNEVSAMWHWRCGFRLLSYPGSLRRRFWSCDAPPSP